MKTTIRLVAAIAVLGFLYSCSDESPEIANESVQFTFDVTDGASSGGRLGELPQGSSIVVSLNDAEGRPVLAQYSINLLKFGDSYITEPVDLAVGRYVISDFMVVNDASEVIYATPKHGSALASAVEHPLPYSFVIAKNKIRNVAMQVIDVKHHKPEEFGYVSFGIDVISPLPVSVFVEENGEMVLTTAHAYFYQENTIKQEAELGAEVNYVPFALDTDVVTRLVIRKEGYVDYVEVFGYDDLIDGGLSGIDAVMTPADKTFTFVDSETQQSIAFNSQGSITIHWPDGSEVVNFGNPTDSATFTKDLLHYYMSPTSERNVTITGDVEKISSIFFTYQTELDVTDLPGLEKVVLHEGSLNLDLTQNPNLNYLYIINTPGVITLPEQHNIATVFLQGEISDPNNLIENIYSNAMEMNIFGGTFSIAGLSDRTEVTAESLSMLNDLESNRGWSIEAW